MLYSDQFGSDQTVQTDFEKGLTVTLDKPSSAWTVKEMVKEMVKVLGNSRTIQILGISEKRLKTLVEDSGYLTQPQLQRISAQTGNSWPRWYVEATVHRAKTAEDRAFVDRARQMWDEIDGRTSPWPIGILASSLNASTRSPKKSAFRTDKSSTLRHAI